MEYYIGQIFEEMYPAEAADWCNHNNAMIVEIEPKDNVRQFQIQALPPVTVAEKKQNVRNVRDNYINTIEWRVSRYRDQVELGIETTDTEETYLEILQYMQYLRDYPESSVTWFEQNPLDFDTWRKELN